MKSPNPTRTKHTRPIDWSKVDWRMQNCALARLLDVSPSTVGQRRQQLNVPRPKSWHQRTVPHPGSEKWQAVDWSQQDCSIAEELGLSRERVRQVRKKLRAPKSHNFGRRRHLHPSTAKQLARIKAQWKKLKGLSWKEAQELLGFRFTRRSPAYQMLKDSRLLIDARAKHPWHKMNFDLPSAVLARIWKLPQCMAFAYRNQKHLQRPKWKARLKALGPLTWPGQRPEFRRAVETEERKAKQQPDANPAMRLTIHRGTHQTATDD